MRNDWIILLVGPNGSGKSTVASELFKRRNWKQVYSYTTRRPRYRGERGHLFVKDEKFDKLTDIVAYTEFNEHRYCATQKQIDDCNIYIVDPRGVFTLIDKYAGTKKFVVCYLNAPQAERRQRMILRGDDPVEIESRLNSEKADFDSQKIALIDKSQYFLSINGGSADDAVNAIEEFVDELFPESLQNRANS